MIELGLMFFASSEDAHSGTGNRYQLILDSARFGDRHGFSAVWVPERHFTRFGCLYPNPAVLQAAIAVATTNIGLRAGSVVVPLHHPIRIAEDWSMVDNLSAGRVGISFASGWNPSDFAFFPERYATRHEAMRTGIDTVLRAWRGEPLSIVNGVGESQELTIFPKPVQKELPFWITAAGNPTTFQYAGEVGGNLLTHLLDQEPEQLAEKIAIYRRARAEHGHAPDSGVVSVMLHTLVGDDRERAREQARRPFCTYIKRNIGLLKGLAKSRDQTLDLSSMSERDLDEFVNFLYDRFASSRGLIGSPESCMPLLQELERVGVDEIACLLDFGPPDEVIRQNLPHLGRLNDLVASTQESERAAAGPRATANRPENARFRPDAVKERCSEQLSGAEFRSLLAGHQVHLGGSFAGVEQVWRTSGEALGLVRLPGHLVASAGPYAIHPAFLDACSQVMGAALPVREHGDEQGLYVPAEIGEVRIHRPIVGQVWSHAVLRAPDPASSDFVGDLCIYDQDGRLEAELSGLCLRDLAGVDAEPPQAGTTAEDAPFYACQWQLVERDESAARASENGGAGWLIFGDRRGVAERLAARLRADGDRCRVVYPTEADQAPEGPESATDPHQVEPHQIGQTVGEWLAGETSCRGVIHLFSLDAVAVEPDSAPATPATTLERDQERCLASAFHLARALAGAELERERCPRLWLVSQDARAVAPDDALRGVAQSTLWGLGRAVMSEHPDLRGTLVDADGAASPEETARELHRLVTARSDDGERLLAVRQGQWYAARLERATPDGDRAVEFVSDATYLITGGLGGLGLELAAWAVRRGARHLVLVGRGAPSSEAEASIAELRAAGGDIRVERADVSVESSLAAVFARAAETLPPIRGIFHLAGVLDDDLVARQDWSRFAPVLAAKVAGTWNLHALSWKLPVEHFVMFSTAATLVTMPGQSSYAAANFFLDSLAHHRRRAGRPALAVNWGPWSSVGHAATEYGARAHQGLAQLGIGHLRPEHALDCLARVMARDITQVGVISIDWQRFVDNAPALAASRFLRDVARGGQAISARESPFVGQLEALPPGERRLHVTNFLAKTIAEVMKLPAGTLPTPRQRLFDMGMDSIMALELKGTLERHLAVPINPTLVFRYPTVEAMVEYFTGVLPVSFAEPLPPEPETSATTAVELDDLSEEEMLQLLTREIEST